MGSRRKRMRAIVAALGRQHGIADAGGRSERLDQRLDDRHIMRHPLLQQQFGCLDHGLGMEAPTHRALAKGIRNGDDAHALVMRHIGAHDRDRCALRQARLRVVQRLVPAIAAAAAGRRQPREIGRGRAGIDHRGERRRIGRDDSVGADAAFQAEARDAEAGILIGEVEVAGVVGGFGRAPRDLPPRAVSHLLAHHLPVRPFEQAAGRRAHDKRWHQILEHRARPGGECRTIPHGGHTPARAGTSGARATRPWRWRRSWRDALQRPEDRSSSIRGYRRRHDSRSTEARDPDSIRKPKLISSNSRRKPATSASRRLERSAISTAEFCFRRIR